MKDDQGIYTLKSNDYAVVWNPEEGYRYLCPQQADDSGLMEEPGAFLGAVVILLAHDVLEMRALCEDVLHAYGAELT